MKSLVKALIIVVVFIGAMVALMAIKGQTMSGKRIHKIVFIETTSDWRKCQLKYANVIDSLNLVEFNTRNRQSQLTTFPVEPGFPFTRLILSWNSARPETSSALNFEVEVSSDGKDWTKFEYLMLGKIDSALRDSLKLPPTEIKKIGKVDVDNLILTKPMRYAKVIVQAIGKDNSQPLTIRRISLSLSSEKSSAKDNSKNEIQKPTPTIGNVRLAVPYFTQRNLPSNLAGNCCSPTSVSMVLNYYGKSVDPETCANDVYDAEHQMYGNWPFNVEAAYLLGMAKTWVEVHSGFDELYDEVASGKPIVISIAYGMNELPNSPIHEAPEGHLIVVVGFDGPNTVICNDPAGHTVDDGIIRYPRKELESIWQAHGGVTYHLWPE